MREGCTERFDCNTCSFASQSETEQLTSICNKKKWSLATGDIIIEKSLKGCNVLKRWHGSITVTVSLSLSEWWDKYYTVRKSLVNWKNVYKLTMVCGDPNTVLHGTICTRII